MKNIKKFESFVNEELNTETYISAAEKLAKMGHRNRADKLKNYAKNQTNKVTPVEVELYDNKYTLTDKNVVVYDDGEKDGRDIHINIVYDSVHANAMDKNDYGDIWENLPNTKKTDFHKEHQSIMSPDEWDEKVLSGEVLNNKWSEMSEEEKGFFEEWNSMNQTITGIYGYSDGGIDCDGIVIQNRKTAFKLMKFIKEYANLHGGKVKEKLQNITVNDLYHD